MFAIVWRIKSLACVISLLMMPLNAQLLSDGGYLDRLSNIESRLTAQQSTIFSLMSRIKGITSDVYSLRSLLYSNNVSADGGTSSHCDCGELKSHLDDLSKRVDGLAESSGAHNLVPRDCSELPEDSPSGVYDLTLGLPGTGTRPTVAAYCDLHEDGGGWTVIQRRGDVRPLQNFDRRWADYRNGFGQLHGEMWWGLENMFLMTGPNDRQYELRVNLIDTEGTARHAIYGEFRVDNEANGYRLTISNYTGDAGDSLSYHTDCKFSTADKDEDLDEKQNCGRQYKSGWWYRACISANLNGLHQYNSRNSNLRITWSKWPGKTYTIKDVVMKIRPVKTA